MKQLHLFPCCDGAGKACSGEPTHIVWSVRRLTRFGPSGQPLRLSPTRVRVGTVCERHSADLQRLAARLGVAVTVERPLPYTTQRDR